MDFITNLLNQILGPVFDFFSFINTQAINFLENIENVITKTEELLNGVANIPIAGLALGPVIVPPIVILSVVGAFGLTIHQLLLTLGGLIDNAKQNPISSSASLVGTLGLGIFAYPVLDKLPEKDQLTKAFIIPLNNSVQRIQSEMNSLTSLIPEKKTKVLSKTTPAKVILSKTTLARAIKK